ncbi:MAG: FABP family protein [Dactylosporangium sp.]|nr:FABP family protein [Dactylosporangium sp.]NNJ63159.1 FABP family protein [Dactylosporangium sp.]
MLPLVGVWCGRGKGGYPATPDDEVQYGAGEYDFAQEVRFSHDGRPFLGYESRSWLLDPDGAALRPLLREVGWWRPVLVDGAATDDLEALLTYPNGVQELYLGTATGTTRFELATDAVVRTSTADPVSAGHRMYGIVDGALLYAYDLAAAGQPLQSHVSARLERVEG